MEIKNPRFSWLGHARIKNVSGMHTAQSPKLDTTREKIAWEAENNMAENSGKRA